MENQLLLLLLFVLFPFFFYCFILFCFVLFCFFKPTGSSLCQVKLWGRTRTVKVLICLIVTLVSRAP